MQILTKPLIRIHLKRYQFCPSRILTLITLLFLVLLIGLGVWQLQRAQQKRILQTAFDARLRATPLTLDQVRADIRSLNYYPIMVTGIYDTSHTVLLDNKVYRGKVGYEVLTPFRPVGSNKLLLIDRGFVPRAQRRTQLPDFPAIDGIQTIRGFIYVSAKAFTLGREANPGRWPLVIQAVDWPYLTNAFHQALYPFTLLLAPTERNGFVREWKPVSSPSYKSVGYAVQWFALALTLLVVFFALNFKKRK